MFPAETTKVGEMEFYLLEDLDFHLVVFHPYRSLLHVTGREPAGQWQIRENPSGGRRRHKEERRRGAEKEGR